ncbi:MAG TPA: chaperone modulator CbpM [Burkholderiales bacterium]|nr:chaperone modulator CbpM [Burkholderiales bacterium]
MKIDIADAQWLHEQADVSFEELVRLSGLAPDLLLELVEFGALTPSNPAAAAQSAQWRFTAECAVAVRRVGRLREDFELDTAALSLALNLVERIQILESEVQSLRSQMPQPRARR